MRGKLWFLGGLAAGFVLGTRAGREKYEELVTAARKVKEHPTVQEAAGVVQEQANRLFTEGKDRLSQSKFAETKVGERLLNGSTSADTTAVLTPAGSARTPSPGPVNRVAGSSETTGTDTSF
jgi:hypothetical protein